MPRVRENRRAFTLVELMVVFAITAILTLIAVGSYASFRKSRQIRSAAESVNSVFVAARSYAIATGQWHRVVFQFKNLAGAEQYSYWVDEIDPFTSAVPNPAIPEPARKAKITTPDVMQEQVKISGIKIDPYPTEFAHPADTYVVVRFFPDGTSDMTSVYLLPIGADPAQDVNYYTVKVYSPTGKSKIIPDDKR
jgi:prepilin-type N-terminal cleavage/methylation domain-containing protein